MTLVPLTYKNFVKNKVNNTIKVKYKDSDALTYIYDNYLDSKSVLNTEVFDNITLAEVDADNNTQLEKIESCFRLLNSYKEDRIKKNTFLGFKDLFHKNDDIKNENLKAYNFRNSFKIERIEQSFLPDSFELQKKNYVKNNLYKAYREDYSLDFYNSLEYGFCNWNTINFFSQRLDSTKNHSNCIVWPNAKNNSGNQYDFLDSNFNISCYINLRKNYNDHSDPECLFHVPDVISVYLIRSFNGNDHRVGITLGNKTKKELSLIQNVNLTNTGDQINLLSQGVYITSGLNILNNRWYNLSINYFKNEDQSRNIQIYVDGILLKSQTLTVANDNVNPINSFICLGNKPRYLETSTYEHVFYQMFSRTFDKDIHLGKNHTLPDDYNIDVTQNFHGNINFEANTGSNSESFHGEIHDIRIYGQTLSEEKIKSNCKETINDLSKEVSDSNLLFYVPVHYLPVYTLKKGPFNASGSKLNLRYSCIYNPYLAATCGGLEVTVENYLVEFVNHTKPNVVIGGDQNQYVYLDNSASSISSLISNTSDVNDIRQGKMTNSIYNKNLTDNNHANYQSNLDYNLSYKNLLILPNDNGIQNVKFDSISKVLSNLNSLSYRSSSIDNTKLFNISNEDIFKDSESNSLSWQLNNASIRVPNFEERTSTIKIRKNGEDKDFTIISRESKNINKMFNVSNFIFHDDRVTDISLLENIDHNSFNNRLTDIKDRIYPVTESNPIIRNYKQDTLTIDYLNSDNVYKVLDSISYIKLPVPYSVINFDYDSVFSTIIDISSKFYNKKLKKGSFLLKDNNLDTSNNNISISLKEDKNAMLFRSDCLTKVANWNYVGHLFYNEGIASLNRPEFSYFGVSDFECEFESDFSMFVHEINIPAEAGLFNKSLNQTYDENLRQDESAFNSEESFVYITDINLHDENLNIVAKAKLARPATKKKSDSILFRLKMDY
tara:strand:+ start:2758 stop:5598 length:2841 start_codon:yes stop_codon:yes gene_type:complete